MKTSLNKARWIEDYLFGLLSPVNRMFFEARLRGNPGLRKDIYFQRKTYMLLKMYHRKKVKEELEILHQRLMNDPQKVSFRNEVLGIFY